MTFGTGQELHSANWRQYELYLQEDGQYAVSPWGQRDKPIAVCPTLAAALAAYRHASDAGVTVATRAFAATAKVAKVTWSSEPLCDPWAPFVEKFPSWKLRDEVEHLRPSVSGDGDGTATD